MNVFLMGFMGSGKTSIGKALAKEMDMPFIDLDAQIEKTENMSISEIFKQKGEPHFRRLEREWLLNLDKDYHIISVGGGTPCFDNNLELMQSNGMTVYLLMQIEMIAERLANAKNTRPIIEPYKNDRDSLVNFINELLLIREPFYKKADLIFESSNMSSVKKKLLVSMVKKCLLQK
jgi:shikimate kinase